jgi:protein TonB
MRMTGTVTVEVIVDEKGRVTKVENASGPSLLKRAAQDAIRRWEFTPFVRDGQPVKATGYVSFNFNL